MTGELRGLEEKSGSDKGHVHTARSESDSRIEQIP